LASQAAIELQAIALPVEYHRRAQCREPCRHDHAARHRTHDVEERFAMAAISSGAVLVGAVLLAANLAAAAELSIGSELQPNSIDPHYHNYGGNKSLSPHVFEPLVLLDAEQRPQPSLALSWRAIDARSWEFKLRPDVRFHDGSPFTTEDVKFTLERAGDVPQSPSSFAVYLRQITAIEIVDATTIRLSTAGAFPLMPVYLSQVPMVSRRHGAGATTSDFNSGRAAIGTGPYRFTAWSPGEWVTLERNQAWWGGREPWDRVRFTYSASAATRIAGLLAGNFDIVDAVPPQDVARLEAEQRLAVWRTISPSVAGFHLDVTERVPPGIAAGDGTALARNPLVDLRVRQAITFAIDREAIAGRLMLGLAKRANQFMPRGSFGHADALEEIVFDPARARQLLAEAGHPNGFRLTIHCQNNRFINDEQICQAAAQMLTRIGIRTAVEAMPHNVHVTRARNREFSMWTGIWGIDTGEPSAPLTTLLATVDNAKGRGQFNRGQYSNPRFDALLDQALAELDDPRRALLFAEATAIAMRDVALVPLHNQMNVWAARRGLAVVPRYDGYTRATGIRPQ
jgi:peptide/nickel transport system substrate-binding protein